MDPINVELTRVPLKKCPLKTPHKKLTSICICTYLTSNAYWFRAK